MCEDDGGCEDAGRVCVGSIIDDAERCVTCRCTQCHLCMYALLHVQMCVCVCVCVSWQCKGS